MSGRRGASLVVAAAFLAVSYVAATASCMEVDDICAPTSSAIGGLNCSANSDGCFARDYSFECLPSSTLVGFDCACFLDGVAAGNCRLDDICRSNGVFFEEDRGVRSEQIYLQLESCCGFDIPF
jgi:hypothetical protein